MKSVRCELFVNLIKKSLTIRFRADGVIGLAARSEAELDDRRRRLRLKIKLNSQEEFNYET
nr:MAG TPA: hypothetical protein [Caudoviricetes sp.]